MRSKLKVIFEAESDTRPVLQGGEEIIREGRAERARLMSNAQQGFFILTNRRLLWHEQPAILRMKWHVGVLNVKDIAAVDKGNIIHFLLGGRRLRLRLRDGKSEYLFQGNIVEEDDLDEWVAAIRGAVAGSR